MCKKKGKKEVGVEPYRIFTLENERLTYFKVQMEDVVCNLMHKFSWVEHNKLA